MSNTTQQIETVVLTRTKSTSKQTEGHLSILGEEICKTLELPWKKNEKRTSCIPAGTYMVTRRYSAKYDHHYLVQGVRNRSMILIHAGNYVYDSKGCIIVGQTHTDINKDGLVDVTASKYTMRRLYELLPERFYLTIQ